MAYTSEDDVTTRKVTLTLDDETLEIFRKAGDGNASLGARTIAKQHSTPATKKYSPRLQAKMKSIAKIPAPCFDHATARTEVREWKVVQAWRNAEPVFAATKISRTCRR